MSRRCWRRTRGMTPGGVGQMGQVGQMDQWDLLDRWDIWVGPLRSARPRGSGRRPLPRVRPLPVRWVPRQTDGRSNGTMVPKGQVGGQMGQMGAQTDRWSVEWDRWVARWTDGWPGMGQVDVPPSIGAPAGFDTTAAPVPAPGRLAARTVAAERGGDAFRGPDIGRSRRRGSHSGDATSQDSARRRRPDKGSGKSASAQAKAASTDLTQKLQDLVLFQRRCEASLRMLRIVRRAPNARWRTFAGE